jgi:hypothetical protein
MVSDGNDLFIVFKGVKIAKRGEPGTPHAGTWISLEPGYVVRDRKGAIVVEFNGVQIQ